MTGRNATGDPGAVEDRLARFHRYFSSGIARVEGWVNPDVRHGLLQVHRIQAERGIGGAIGEIGVHHGKFFIALHNLKNDGERSFAIDLFDRQALNVDGSGSGSLRMFLENVREHCLDPDDVRYLQADSIELSRSDVSAIAHELGRFRLFSIDGGHTPEHTVNDFLIAQDLAANGGVVFVDDYYNPHWPGVHEGIASIYGSSRPKLAPFAYSGGKLLLTTISYHDAYYRSFTSAFPADPAFKAVRMHGWPVAVTS